MDLETVKSFVEKGCGDYESSIDSMPPRFIDPMVMQGIRIDQIERGRILCSFTVPPRLVNTGNSLHGGATATLVDMVSSAVILTTGAPHTGVSVEINVSYLSGAYVGEEVEIESKALRVGKAIAVVSVELRSKKTGNIIAQGRHTKYTQQVINDQDNKIVRNLVVFFFPSVYMELGLLGDDMYHEKKTVHFARNGMCHADWYTRNYNYYN